MADSTDAGPRAVLAEAAAAAAAVSRYVPLMMASSIN